MKKVATIVLLAGLLSITASAGEIPTSGVTATSLQGPQPTSSVPGEVPTVGSSYEIADTALDLIQMFIGFGV